MRRKNVVLGALVCLNVGLLAALVMATYRLPAAFGQPTGLAGNYLVVAGEIQDGYDALYMIDMKERALHAFYYDRGTRKLEVGGARDLERDFRNKE